MDRFAIDRFYKTATRGVAVFGVVMFGIGCATGFLLCKYVEDQHQKRVQ